MTYGRRIRDIRKALGWTQEELASRVPGMSRATLSKIEVDLRASLSLDEAVALCRAFGITVDDLVSGRPLNFTVTREVA